MTGRTATERGAGTGAGSTDGSAAPAASKAALFDLSDVDLAARRVSRQQIETMNPHRGNMALLDWIVWHSPDFKRGIGLHHTRRDEFWVPGHFPEKPLLPGVLMVEMGAQLAVFLYNARFPRPKLVGFTRIEDCTFRSSVTPGDDLYLLCLEVKCSPRRFISDIQGWVDGKRLAFEARITGMALEGEFSAGFNGQG